MATQEGTLNLSPVLQQLVGPNARSFQFQAVHIVKGYPKKWPYQ